MSDPDLEEQQAEAHITKSRRLQKNAIKKKTNVFYTTIVFVYLVCVWMLVKG